MRCESKVSVVIPVYNGAKFLNQAINSVLDQTWPNFDLVIVDNASNDDSVKVASKFQDPRITIHAEGIHLPIYANFNRAAGYAQGRFLKFLCADDILLPPALEVLVKVMMDEPLIGIATSKRIVIDENAKQKGLLQLEHESGHIRSWKALKLVTLLNNYIGEPSSVLLRREQFIALGGFDERFHQLGDLHLWCKILAKHDLYYHPTALCCYRIHNEQLSWKNLRNFRLWLREDRWVRQSFRVLGLRKNWIYRLLLQVQTRTGLRRKY